MYGIENMKKKPNQLARKITKIYVCTVSVRICENCLSAQKQYTNLIQDMFYPWIKSIICLVATAHIKSEGIL